MVRVLLLMAALFAIHGDATAQPPECKLIAAAQGGSVAEIRQLLIDGADINCRKETHTVGRTPLMKAAAWGHKDAVELLVEEGADINLRDSENHDALYLAVFFKKFEVAAYLAERIGPTKINYRIWGESGVYYGLLNEDGEPSRYGRFVWNDGDSYEGGFAQGGFHLHGKLLIDGSVYEGDFFLGSKHGVGSLLFPDGAKFSGWWQGPFDKQCRWYANGMDVGPLPKGPVQDCKLTGKSFDDVVAEFSAASGETFEGRKAVKKTRAKILEWQAEVAAEERQRIASSPSRSSSGAVVESGGQGDGFSLVGALAVLWGVSAAKSLGEIFIPEPPQTGDSGSIHITATHGEVLTTTADRFVVKLQGTNGSYRKEADESGSSFLSDGYANFYYLPKGEYRIEISGYDRVGGGIFNMTTTYSYGGGHRFCEANISSKTLVCR